MPAAVAAKQLAEAAVDAAHRRDGRVGVLDGVDVGIAVAVKVPGARP
jgi:hypothetical protein